MVTLGEAMGQAGYMTALCGKWHLGRDEDTGFRQAETWDIFAGDAQPHLDQNQSTKKASGRRQMELDRPWD